MPYKAAIKTQNVSFSGEEIVMGAQSFAILEEE